MTELRARQAAPPPSRFDGGGPRGPTADLLGVHVADLDLLRLSLLRQRRAAQNADDSAFIDLDEEFHLMLADGSGAQHVARLLGQLGAFVRIMRLGAGRSQEELVDVVAEHEAIVDAVESRDEEAAAAALVAHLRAPA